jgi:hypothetical protein
MNGQMEAFRTIVAALAKHKDLQLVADTRREPKTANANWWKLPTGSLPITAWKVFEYGK